MDYSQFFNMIPEATLVAILIIIFLADLIMKVEKKVSSLALLMNVLLVVQGATRFPCASCIHGAGQIQSHIVPVRGKKKVTREKRNKQRAALTA